MSAGLISILLPVYNGAPFLEACIQSIINQTTDEWELIAVDDQSKDSSINILQKFAKTDQRIRVYNNPEKGLIPALQMALSLCSGQWVTRMDQDDIMPSGKLLSLRNLLQAKGPRYISTGMVKYFADGELGDGYRKYERWINKLAVNDSHYEEIYKECPLPSPCWMVARSDLLACGGFNDIHYPEDYDLCFRFRRSGYKIVAAKEVLHYWRDHLERASRKEHWYVDHTFLTFKLSRFLTDDYDSTRPLVLWGAGKKGKRIAQMLIQKNIRFEWVCDNPQKWGHVILGTTWQSYRRIEKINHPQVVVLVADPRGQKQIKDYLSELHEQVSAFHFC